MVYHMIMILFTHIHLSIDGQDNNVILINIQENIDQDPIDESLITNQKSNDMGVKDIIDENLFLNKAFAIIVGLLLISLLVSAILANNPSFFPIGLVMCLIVVCLLLFFFAVYNSSFNNFLTYFY